MGAQMLKTMLVCTVTICLAVCAEVRSENLIRNGSFELPFQVGTTSMLQGQEPNQVHFGDFKRWETTGAEAWWTDGEHQGPAHIVWTDAAEQARSGSRALKLTAGEKSVAIVNGFGQIVEPGTYTFSVWVKTEGATGGVQFRASNSHGDQLMNFMNGTVRKDVALPGDADWTRLHAVLEVPKTELPQMAVVRVEVSKGTVWLDDVQIEAGAAPTPFNVRPGEQVRVEPASGPAMPIFTAGKEKTFAVRLTCDSRRPLRGTLSLRVARCTLENAKVVWEKPIDNWAHGQSLDVDIDLSGLTADAYVVTARLDDGDDVLIDGAKYVNPRAKIGGSISTALLKAPSAARFIVTPATPPRQMFGSANRMLSTGGSAWGGFPLWDFVQSRRIGYIASNAAPHGWGDDNLYLNAAGGFKIDTHADSPLRQIRNLPPEAQNPANPRLVDLTTETGYRMMIDQAHEWGRELLARPVVGYLNLYGEQMLMQRGELCPSESADRDFRNWVQARHQTLEALSERWGRKVASWDEVKQIVSADMVDSELEKEQLEGAEAIAWTAVADKLSRQQAELMRQDRGRGMDWLQWRYHWTTKAYINFAQAFREVNQYTVLDSSFCWPNFRPQMTMKFYRAVGAAGLDVEYCAGQKPGLGTPQEMIDILEMAESCIETPDRSGARPPIWGHEIYVQPTFADDYAALQMWGLVAHGMTVVGNFCWKPYSDHGPVRENEAWKKDGAHPMWFIIDVDGTRLPNYYGIVRATRQLNAFHERYNGISLRRAKTNVAMFVSPDSGVRSHYSSGGREWLSPIPSSRAALSYLLRLEGISADYLDDQTLPKHSSAYDILLVPFSPVLSQADAERLMTFARDGGTLVLVGASGIEDPWLNRHGTLGGPAWKDLNWEAPEFDMDPPTVIQPAEGEAQIKYTSFKGDGCGTVPGAKVLMVNDAQEPVAWEKPIGKGRVIAIGPYPYTYSQNPHMPAGLRDFAQRLVAWTGMKATARWTTDTAPTPEATYGTGAPIVNVVRRDKSADEQFIFVMNTGGKGRGRVQITVDDADWRVTDALNQLPVEEAGREGTTITIPLLLRPWQYRVFHLARQPAGKPG